MDGSNTPPPTDPPSTDASYYNSPAASAARQASRQRHPQGGIVAVKVQYPDAQRTMQQDMSNLRLAAAFLQKTELKFDLVSAIDELSAQLRLEFDFEREARVMDAVSKHLMVFMGGDMFSVCKGWICVWRVILVFGG